jgi:hypothetical protein
MPDDQIAELDIPTGIPLAYRLGPDMRPAAQSGRYLDPRAARDAIDAIRNSGRLAQGQGHLSRTGGGDGYRGRRGVGHGTA